MSNVRHGVVGAIEAGGTKFICAIGSGSDGDVLERTQFATGDRPSELMEKVVAWFTQQQSNHGKLQAFGVASFGPVDLNQNSPTYGFITTTPKQGWQNTDLLGPLRQAFPGLTIGFDTDVNGAALGEATWGAAQGLEDFIYITIGTGIGGGGMARGRLLHGLMHPEMGHIGLPTLGYDDFAGACPFHGRCWEGLCSGPAIAKRTGMTAENLAPNHPAWSLTIRYMAHALANLTYVLSPQRIILGGSVRKAGQLGEQAFFERLRADLREILSNYIAAPELSLQGIESYIVAPQLGDDAGIRGAIALAHAALNSIPVHSR